MIELILIGVICACLTHFLNYCIGKPGSKEFSPYEIFSSYTVWLSKRRLKDLGLYQTYAAQYNDNLQRTKSKSDVFTLKKEFNKMIYEAAEPLFTWERAAGMCPVCFGFWVSLISATFVFKNVVDLLIIIVVSHIIIRLLSKIL